MEDHPDFTENELPLKDDRLPEPARPREHVAADYHKRKFNPKKLLVYLAVLIILAAAAGAVYKFVIKSKPAAPAKQAQTTQAKPAELIESTTKHYESPNFYLSLDYPANWAVSDNSGDKLTVSSPELKLKSAAGQKVDGQIVLTITQKGQNLASFVAGNAVAVLDSEKINYTKPTSTQRASTYLSFLQYAKTTASGALDGIYVTGNLGYQRQQDVPKTDIAGVDPEIIVVFKSGSQPLSIASSSWNDVQLSAPIKKMLASLAIN